MRDDFPTVPYERPRLSHAESIDRAREFLQELRLRRSVRHFSDEAVPDDVLTLAIEAAAAAPSGANMQPWKFIVVRDPVLKHRIRIAAEEEEKENYNGRMPQEWLRALAPLHTDWRKEFLDTAPALIVVFKEEYGLTGGGRVTHYYVNESVGIACGFLLAALNAAGLATLTHTPSPMGFCATSSSGRKTRSLFSSYRPYIRQPAVAYPIFVRSGSRKSSWSDEAVFFDTAHRTRSRYLSAAPALARVAAPEQRLIEAMLHELERLRLHP